MVRGRRHVGLERSLAGFPAVPAPGMFTLTAGAEENFITPASTTSTADPGLFDPYGVILVNPERHPHVKAEEGRAFYRLAR